MGWFCALPKEQTAATAVLDHKQGDLPKPPNDYNTYTLGSVDKHNVAIACLPKLPKGEIRTSPAATVATQMTSTFPSIKVGLMVSIGRGIPPTVRLSDVVVSSPVDQYPGAVQWDLGKATQGGRFERYESLNTRPRSLRTALTKLETEHEMSRSKITQYLVDLKSKWPNLALKYDSCDHLKDPSDAMGDPYRSRRWQSVFPVLRETILALLRFLLDWWVLASIDYGAPASGQAADIMVNTAVDGGSRKA